MLGERTEHRRVAAELCHVHARLRCLRIHHATIKGDSAIDQVDQDWYEGEFIPKVQQRGAAIIKARGASSAASAAGSAIDHMRSWALGTADGDWVSMGVSSDGSYGIEEGIVYSYPCTCKNGKYEIVQGLDINDFSRDRMNATETELREERSAVEDLL